jgi:carbamoyl-phosphate synthase large subunit
MNVQFAVQDGTVFILEVNPRASRTIPFVAKATGLPIANIAAKVMVGEKLSSFNLLERSSQNHVAVKEAVFSFSRFPGVDIILGPEMRSTGEVMGIDKDFSRAFAKSQLAAGIALPKRGTVFLSVRDRDKNAACSLAKRLQGLGFDIMATSGTMKYLATQSIAVRRINKVLEGRPHCVDAIKSGEVQLIINTNEGVQSIEDSFSIRQSALIGNIPHYTTVTGAAAAISAIEALIIAQCSGGLEVASLQSYFRGSS